MHRKSKAEWSIEKPKLDNARQLLGIFFIEPDDEEFKLTMKGAPRKLDFPMPAAMLCKISVNCRGETCRSIAKSKTKYACIVGADETMRIRLEGVPHRYNEDHITAKGLNSLTHYSLVRKSIPMPQASKIPDPKAAVGKCDNRRKLWNGSWRKSETKMRWSLKQGLLAEKCIFRH